MLRGLPKSLQTSECQTRLLTNRQARRMPLALDPYKYEGFIVLGVALLADC
jgi:hypothetical protein